VATLDECLRCERIFDDAAIPFKLVIEGDNHLLIDIIEDRFLDVTLDLLRRASFTVDIVPP
jgi:hypothetical protein